MYAYLKGKVTFRSPARMILEVGGVGFSINTPLSTFSASDGKDEMTIFTHFQVREDAHSLFGFSTDTERNMFEQLISVTGVGAVSALVILSSMSVEEIRGAILGERSDIFQKVKGIGPKASKQIILDLKSKFAKDSGPDTASILSGGANNTAREEALSALVALGFNRILVQKALNTVIVSNPGATKVEDLIKLALKNLS
jgi:holliday junction DNA helicase RuvA